MKKPKPETTGLLPELGAPTSAQRGEQLIQAAYKDGRITASRRAHYRRMYERDPVGTQLLLAKLAPGLPPATQGKTTGLLRELRDN